MTEAAVNDPSASDDAGRPPAPSPALAAYTQVYEEHNSRLVGYAHTLTGNRSTAEDLVAEAHFRVWRRISAGHPVENVPAYLATTVRNLASTLHRGTTEIPLPTETAEAESARPREAGGSASSPDPSQQIAHVDFIARLLKDLPERWVRALWLAEVEDLPLEAVGRHIGATSNATAVLLNRAREGLRQAFLRGYPGAPAAEACAKHWHKMPSLVRGGLSARQTDSLRAHAEQCDDCRARLAALQQVNLRLPALLGPALLLLTLGDGSLRLFGAAGVVGGAKAAGGTAGGVRHLQHVSGKLRHGVSSGGGKTAAVSAGVVGSAAIAVAAVALTGGAAHPHATPSPPIESQQPAKAAAIPAAKSAPAKQAPAQAAPAKSAAVQPALAKPMPAQAAAKQAAAPTPAPPPAPTSPPAEPASAPLPAPEPQPAAAPAPYTPRHAAPEPVAPPPTTAPPSPPTATPSSSPTPIAPQPPATPPSDHDLTVTVKVTPDLGVSVTVHRALPPYGDKAQGQGPREDPGADGGDNSHNPRTIGTTGEHITGSAAVSSKSPG